MSNEKIVQPDSLRTPAEQASINAMITQAVREVFASMAPVLQSIALTPEKLAEAQRLGRQPDAAVLAREARERQNMREDLANAERDKLAKQAACSHQDANSKWSISLVHNYPDRQTRGVCHHCLKVFEPRRWTIGAPDEKNPRGCPKLVDADPQYHIIRQIEATQPA